MRLKILFPALLLIASAFDCVAQNGTVRGIVQDTRDNQTLIGATVSVYPVGDSSRQQAVITDIDGNYTIQNVAPGVYTLRSIYISYNNYYQTITVGVDTLQANIQMSPTVSTLQNVTVVGQQVRSQQIGDTTQFNANAFKTNPDANAEDLITKMPGVTSENGTVKVNGEEVKSVYVDGKPFFGDDPNAALKNLPAEVIDKIQVFDKQSDQAQFTGFDDGNTSKSINIVTKRGRNNGVFGRIQGGYGTDDRYTGGLSLNYFNGDRRITLIGLANNINQQNFSSEDLLGVSGQSSGGGRSSRGGRAGGSSGGFSGGGGQGGQYGGGSDGSNFLVSQQGGITTTQSGGVNFSDIWGKKNNVKVSGSYFYNRTENTNNTSLTRRYITADKETDSVLTYNEEGVSRSTGFNHRANLRLDWEIDSNNSLVFTPRLSYQNNETERNLNGNTNVGLTDTQSTLINRYLANNAGYNLSGGLLYRHKFGKRGRTFSTFVNASRNFKDGDGLLYSNNTFSGSGSTINDQRFNLESDGLNISANVNYTEPLSKKSQLMLTYNPSFSENNSDRYTYNNSTTGTYTDLDTGLTNVFANDYNYQRGGVGYRFQDSAFNGMITLNGQYATLTGEQTYPYLLDVDRGFRDLLPQAMLNYRFSRTENIRMNYRTSVNAPSISQLQNIVDNSNPLLLRTGNPDLRQDYNHNVSIRYGNTRSKSGKSFFVFASGSYINNYIGNATIIAVNDTSVRNGKGNVDLARGTQLSLPVNLSGAYNARTFFTYSMPLQKLKTNLNLNAGFTLNRTPAIINNLENFSNNYVYNGGLVLSSNISENVDFTLSYNGSYTMTRNTLQTETPYNYYSQTTSARINYIFLGGFVFNTQLNHTLFSGLGEGYDRSFLLWNASLGYKFGKAKAWQADVYAFDILGQNNSIARTITETYIEDSRTQVLQRYLMLRLTYTLRQFKGAAQDNQRTDDLRPEGPRPERQGDGGDRRQRPGGEGGFRD